MNLAPEGKSFQAPVWNSSLRDPTVISKSAVANVLIPRLLRYNPTPPKKRGWSSSIIPRPEGVVIIGIPSKSANAFNSS